MTIEINPRVKRQKQMAQKYIKMFASGYRRDVIIDFLADEFYLRPTTVRDILSPMRQLEKGINPDARFGITQPAAEFRNA